MGGRETKRRLWINSGTCKKVGCAPDRLKAELRTHARSLACSCGMNAALQTHHFSHGYHFFTYPSAHSVVLSE